jgi:GDP-4-dehydro-6-deoxy-D-mannose reductase
MRVLLTGSTGFVGGVVQEQWRELVLWPRSADLTDQSAVAAELERIDLESVDAVLHLAAQSNPAKSVDCAVGTWQVNLMGTVHLLEGLTQYGWQGAFLFASSGAVYGGITGRVDEDSPTTVSSPYVASKLAAESAVREWALRTGNRGVIARPFNHSGPGQSTRYFLPSMARQIAGLPAKGGEIEVGNLEVQRDFCHVRDVVRAYRVLLQRGKSGEIYNLASGRSVTLNDVLARMAELSGREVRLKVTPERFREEDPRPIEVDLGKVFEHAGWRAETDLDSLLRDLLQDWKTRDCQSQR